MSVFMTGSVYGTRGRSEPAIAGSAACSWSLYPVNFGSAVTATAAADSTGAGTLGRSAWTPPTSTGGPSVVVVGSSWQTTSLTLVVSLFLPLSTSQDANASMSGGP